MRSAGKIYYGFSGFYAGIGGLAERTGVFAFNIVLFGKFLILLYSHRRLMSNIFKKF